MENYVRAIELNNEGVASLEAGDCHSAFHSFQKAVQHIKICAANASSVSAPCCEQVVLQESRLSYSSVYLSNGPTSCTSLVHMNFSQQDKVPEALERTDIEASVILFNMGISYLFLAQQSQNASGKKLLAGAVKLFDMAYLVLCRNGVIDSPDQVIFDELSLTLASLILSNLFEVLMSQGRLEDARNVHLELGALEGAAADFDVMVDLDAYVAAAAA